MVHGTCPKCRHDPLEVQPLGVEKAIRLGEVAHGRVRDSAESIFRLGMSRPELAGPEPKRTKTGDGTSPPSPIYCTEEEEAAEAAVELAKAAAEEVAKAAAEEVAKAAAVAMAAAVEEAKAFIREMVAAQEEAKVAAQEEAKAFLRELVAAQEEEIGRAHV